MKINSYYLYDVDQIHVYFLYADFKYTCAAFMVYWPCACISWCKHLRSGPDVCRHVTFPAKYDSEMDQQGSDLSSMDLECMVRHAETVFFHAKIAKQREVS